jgi:PAS domain S-box-containing protein
MISSAPHDKKSDVFFELLVRSVRDYAIFALDPQGVIISWNVGAERAKGYKAHEIIGKHFSVFYPPEDIGSGKPVSLLKAAENLGHVEDEGWRIRKDGSRFWADVVITALRNEAGTLVGYAKVTRDLTERLEADQALRTSEERFRLIVQSVKDYGIFMLDPLGRVMSWNEGAERMKGYTATEIIGRHFSAFYPAEDIAADKPATELRIAVKEGRYEEEGWRVRKDGSLFWASVVITAVWNAKNVLVGFAKVTRDLTERRASEQRAIADARRLAESETANRAKSEFLAAMSHELRTPLNAIGGYTELIEMGIGGDVSAQQQEYLGRIRTAQQHLLSLINDLLNYSKIESGQVTYELEAVALHEIVDRVLALVEPQAHAKGLVLRHGPCNHATALADQLKTEQIVLNLLSNAVKFTPDGGRITMQCGTTGSDAFITVSDTGPGIPLDMQNAVFEPFVQLGRSLTHTQEGTGLGLAISRDLARAMGGDVTLVSTPSQGATFTLKLRRHSA